jgi:hypothetical protein
VNRDLRNSGARGKFLFQGPYFSQKRWRKKIIFRTLKKGSKNFSGINGQNNFSQQIPEKHG